MMSASFLSDQCRALILGSLLGDGSLRVHSGYREARFAFRHSEKQGDYFWWKVKQLSEISGVSHSWQQPADGFGGAKLRYQSRAHPGLTELYRLTTDHGRLRIRRRWLNLLTPLSLAVWWLDDGSIITNGRRGVFCTDPFSYEEQAILARYLENVWDVRVAISPIIRTRVGIEHQYFRLWIRSSAELQKLLRIILPHVAVETMLDKVLLLYINPELQQRWISEVSTATGFPIPVVERAVARKKARWRRFRE